MPADYLAERDNYNVVVSLRETKFVHSVPEQWTIWPRRSHATLLRESSNMLLPRERLFAYR